MKSLSDKLRKLDISKLNLIEEGVFLLSIVVLTFFLIGNILDNDFVFWLYIIIELVIWVLYFKIGRLKQKTNNKKYYSLFILCPWIVGNFAFLMNIINFIWGKYFTGNDLPKALNIGINLFGFSLIVQIFVAILIYVLFFNYLEINKNKKIRFYEEFSNDNYNEIIIKNLIKNGNYFNFYSENTETNIDPKIIINNLNNLHTKNIKEYLELKFNLLNLINDNSIGILGLLISITTALISINLSMMEDIFKPLSPLLSSLSVIGQYIYPVVLLAFIAVGIEYCLLLEPNKSKYRKILLYFEEAENKDN